MSYLQKTDSEIAELLKKEAGRQHDTIDLIPSENIVSRAVLETLGSELTNKYSEGYPHKRYYGGNEFIDDVEILAQERARRVFRLGKEWHVNVQPYSGSPANLAVYMGLLDPGDTVLGMSLPFGGHLTHGWKVSATGKFYHAVHYTLDKEGYLDFEEIWNLAQKESPKLIIAGATAYSRTIDFKKFAAVASGCGAYLMVDMAHIAGLIAAGSHPSPFPYADVVTTTTHKTLRGPRGALIFVNKSSKTAQSRNADIALAIDKAVFPGLQGGPHDNQTAAIAVALGEALKPSFRRYGQQIVKNAKALAEELMKQGLTIVSGGTDNHLMLIDLTKRGISGKEAQEKLEKVGIIVNRNAIPYDPRPPFDPSGIRIGTPSVTTRGMKEKEMKMIAEFLAEAVQAKNLAPIKTQVRSLCKKFPAVVAA